MNKAQKIVEWMLDDLIQEQDKRRDQLRLKELRELLSTQPEKPAFDFSKIVAWRRTLHGGNGGCEYTIRIDGESRDENFGEFLRAVTEKPAARQLRRWDLEP